MGYHIIDLLMWYFGLPDLVFAETSCDAKEGVFYDAEDTAQVIFRYAKKNIFGTLLVSRVIPPKTEYFDIYGTRGIIHIERGKIERRAPNGEVQEALSREQHWSSAAQDQLEYFVKVIRGEKENISGPDFHFNHLVFIEAAYLSKKSGQFVSP
jgi:predicted dehydrogenase